MKFVDKYGNEIDCTVEEYRELVGLEVKEEEPKKVIVVKQQIKKPKKRRSFERIDWDAKSKDAYDLMRNGKAKNIKHLLRLLKVACGGQNTTALENALRKNFNTDLNLIRGAVRRKKRIKKSTGPKDCTKQANRMNFIHSRIKTLTKADPTMSYNEAFRRASFEYQNKCSIAPKPTVIADNMPYFRTLNEKGNSLIEGVVKTVIANRSQMTYLLDGKMLGLGSGTQWRNFCEEFKMLGKEICDYFGVKDCFCFMRIDDKYDVIRYDYK